jgi:hypothetical protein
MCFVPDNINVQQANSVYYWNRFVTGINIVYKVMMKGFVNTHVRPSAHVVNLKPTAAE